MQSLTISLAEQFLAGSSQKATLATAESAASTDIRGINGDIDSHQHIGNSDAGTQRRRAAARQRAEKFRPDGRRRIGVARHFSVAKGPFGSRSSSIFLLPLQNLPRDPARNTSSTRGDTQLAKAAAGGDVYTYVNPPRMEQIQ